MKYLLSVLILGLIVVIAYCQPIGPLPPQPDVRQVWQELQDVQNYLAPSTRPAAPQRGWFCTNISSNNYFTNIVYADMGRQASGFYPLNSPTPIQYTNHAYPVGLNIHARANLNPVNIPAPCDVTVSWTGNAQLQFLIYGQGSFQSTGSNSGVLHLPQSTAFDANNQANLNTIWIDVLSSDPANPLDNLHLWLPGYGPNTPKKNQVFRDEYLKTLTGFAGMRFMPFTGATTSTEVNPEDMVPVEGWDWTTRGAPYPVALELFNEVRKINPKMNRVWVTVPPTSSAPYQKVVTQLFHDGLPPGCELIMERGNENWNTGAPHLGWDYINNLGNVAQISKYDGTYDANGKWVSTPSGNPWVTDALTRPIRANADIVHDMSLAIRPIYADRPGDLTVVLGVQSGNPYWAQEGMKWLKAAYGDPGIDAIADAPYFGWDSYSWPNKFVPSADPVMADYHAGVELDFEQYISTWTSAITAVCHQYNVKHYNYEGNNSFWSNPFSKTGVGYLYLTSPEIAKDLGRYWSLLREGGVDCYFDFLHGPAEMWDQWGFWPDIQNFDATSPVGPGQSNYRWMETQRACLRWN